MGGVERASFGSVTTLGRDLSDMSEDALARFRRAHMSIVFQSFHLIPTMTAVENVATPLELAGVNNAMSSAREELGNVGLGDRADHYPAQLSGGEQQRVALARASITRHDILLADEPTGNLDQETSTSIIDLLFSLTTKFKTTLILITHDIAIGKRCRREVHIADGQVSNEAIR